MYNWKKRVCVGIVFCIGLMLCIVSLAGCDDAEKQQAMARAAAAEAELQETKTQLQTTQGERDELKTTVGDLSKSVQDFKSQLNIVTQLKDQVSAINTEREAAISQLKDQVSTINKESEAAISQIKDQVSAINKEREAAMAKVVDAQAKIEKMTSQLQEQVQKVLAIEELNKKLQATIDELKKNLVGEIKLPQIPDLEKN
jgi:chromosome segregation ATPase